MSMVGALIRSKRKLRVSDSFNRGNSTTTMGTADTGQAWGYFVGTWGISSNRAYCVSDANARGARISTGLLNAKVQCGMYGEINSLVTNRVPNLIFHYGDSNNFLYARVFNGNAELYKYDGGAASLLASAVQAMADGVEYTLTAAFMENNINIAVDGVSLIDHVLAGGDTKYAAYASVGFWLEKTGSPTIAARWDNLIVEAA